VKYAFDSREEEDAQVVIYGIPGHAEVNGLIGQTNNNAIIITSEDDLDKIDFKKPVLLFSQTTKSTDKFYRIKQLIEQRSQEAGNDSVVANDTICRQVSNREPQLKRFVKNFDVVIFVSGRKSSNGKVLYNVCRAENPQSYFISDVEEIQPEWLAQANSVGICGATSTPMWLMEKVADHIRNLANTFQPATT
jgi:4-hydroxy-3-methylbut-2-enyl diphosphate reductase